MHRYALNDVYEVSHYTSLMIHHQGRAEIAVAFNKAISNGELKGPVVLSRDHHDCSGTDSPFRETSDVYV